jgi:hypothetical protein
LRDKDRTKYQRSREAEAERMRKVPETMPVLLLLPEVSTRNNVSRETKLYEGRWAFKKSRFENLLFHAYVNMHRSVVSPQPVFQNLAVN